MRQAGRGLSSQVGGGCDEWPGDESYMAAALSSPYLLISQSLLVIMHNSGTIISRTVVGCQVNRQL